MLPECNQLGVRAVVGRSVLSEADRSGFCWGWLVWDALAWWLVVLVGMRAKQFVLVPPFLYEPITPGRAR